VRTHPTRRLTAALAVAVVTPTLAVSALVAGASTSAGVAPDTLADVGVAAAPTVQIQPGALPRGENPQVAVMVDDTILDGDVRVPVAGDSAWLLGTSGEDYLVAVFNAESQDGPKVFRVHRDGSRELLLEAGPSQQVLASQDGEQVIRYASHRSAGKFTTAIVVNDSHTGDRVARRTFTGVLDVLDADEGRMVLGGMTPRNRTLWWNVSSDATNRILRQAGYHADIRADRLATYNDDPYMGGCSTLRVLSAPGQVLTRSCKERVAEISPSGRRIVVMHILTDGLGPREIKVRGHHGRKLATYEVGGWFGQLQWETNRALLMEAFGKKKTALVRCELAECERASATRPTVFP
jgi:hypothetical protein